MPAFLQTWVTDLPATAQQILLTALRGPDIEDRAGPAKRLVRKFRRLVCRDCVTGRVLTDADTDLGGGFLAFEPKPAPELAHLVAAGCYPTHWLDHLVEATAVLARFHVDIDVREIWVEVNRILTGHVWPMAGHRTMAQVAADERRA